MANVKRFTLRVNEELYEKIRIVAEVHKRSTAKEIEVAIDEYLEQFNSIISTSDQSVFHLSKNSQDELD